MPQIPDIAWVHASKTAYNCIPAFGMLGPSRRACLVFSAGKRLQFRCGASQGPPGAFLSWRHPLNELTVSTSLRCLLSACYGSKRTFSTTRTLAQLSPTSTPNAEMSFHELNSRSLGLRERTDLVYEILCHGEPSQILEALANPTNQQVVASLPDSVFVSAFLRLTPEYFIEPFLGVLLPVHERRLSQKGLNTVEGVMDRFFRPLNQILRARRGSGGENTFGLLEYRHLLRISASIGDRNTCMELWKGMKYLGIKPDLQCYNSLLHACVWEGAVFGPGRYRLRVTPFYYRSRAVPRPRERFKGFGTAARSVRKQVYSFILEMREANLPLNEDTYIYMLLASARVGSSSGMNQVLKMVWGVDAEALANTPEENLPAAKSLPASSPMYPSRKLLLAVAHAYGTNSMFETSLQIVKYISNQFGIEITDDVWAELFERAFVLSRKRYGKDSQPLLLGKINSDILYDLKNMLQLDGKPYDMNLYRMLATTACVKARYDKYQEVTREAYNLLRKTRRERNHALRVLENYLGVSLRIQSPSSSASLDERARLCANCSTPHVWRALRKYELLRLLVEQQQSLMEKMAGYAIINQKYWPGPFHSEWAHRLLPQFIAEWKDFLPESYKVYLNNVGEMEFVGRTTFMDANFRVHGNEPVRWSDCGSGFVAEEYDDNAADDHDDQAIEVSHDVLWAHFKARFGPLAMLQPFRWFFEKGWSRAPVLLQTVEHMEDKFKDKGSRRLLAEERQQSSTLIKHERMQHAHYVTMEPFYIPLSL
ncbi:hypothetical protein UA08_03517 [Talaromyces atroroseus]|uniref:Mitochondrial ATPase expression-domain-containing protein n=1 Tax=Talaromyces atroroseus TaxID=1441469 RepID=A0A225B0N1_TALAT|nr:hypothetical protein UA08_03517 [Talaromyces atroroseus]OKL61529.1 hypothetical protein UA08_03517 [Talaromyces atroroseus]